MTGYEDETERADLAMQDHKKARDLMERAIDRYSDNAEDVETIAEELYDAAEKLEDDAARAVAILADYLMEDRKALDDKATELREEADDLEETIDDILTGSGASDPSDVYDALTPSRAHNARLANMRNRVDNVYFD